MLFGCQLFVPISAIWKLSCLPVTPSQDICMLPVLQNPIPKTQGGFLRSSLLERASPFFELPEDHIWFLYPTLYYSYVCHITEMRFNTLELNFHSVSYIMCSGWVKGQHELIFCLFVWCFFILGSGNRALDVIARLRRSGGRDFS